MIMCKMLIFSGALFLKAGVRSLVSSNIKKETWQSPTPVIFPPKDSNKILTAWLFLLALKKIWVESQTRVFYSQQLMFSLMFY